jgi:uncharacterized protein
MSLKGQLMSQHRDNPFLIDIHRLSRQSGTAVHLERAVVTDQPFGDEVIALAAGCPIDLSLDLTAVGHGVLVNGQASYQLAGHCSRCLEPVAQPRQVRFQDLFVYQLGAASPIHGSARPSRPAGQVRPRPRDDGAGLEQGEPAEHGLTDGFSIDIESLVRDAVLLDLPWTPLCRDDCAGLCAECGVNLNQHPSHRHADAFDARWTGLADWVASGESESG